MHIFKELSNRFSQLEKHCISLEIAMQQNKEQFLINQPRKNSDLPELREYFMINELKAQIETKDLTITHLKHHINEMNDMCCNLKAKATHDNNIDSTTITELVHKVSMMYNENETLKRHRKTLNEFIKEKRSEISKHTKSLIAQNDELKTELQKKNFEITTLKNELLKLTKKDVNTKFDKSSILGAPPSLPHRKPRSTRQLSAFSTNRSKFSKSRCAPQVDTKHELSKPVTTQCHHKVGPYLENLIRKDCVVNVGIPTMSRIPSLKNNYPIRLNSPSTRQSSIRLGRSGDMLSNTCLKWVPMGRIFKLIGLSWIPMRSTENIKVNCTTLTLWGSNNTNSCPDKQTFHVSAGSSILSAGPPTKKLKVWRPKRPLPTVIGTLENWQC